LVSLHGAVVFGFASRLTLVCDLVFLAAGTWLHGDDIAANPGQEPGARAQEETPLELNSQNSHALRHLVRVTD